MPLLDPDEGLHAAIAQEMVERGDWVTPRLLGEPFLDKPILFFWALAASLGLFGSNEFAFGCLACSSALLGALATGLLAAPLLRRAAGLARLGFYATMLCRSHSRRRRCTTSRWCRGSTWRCSRSATPPPTARAATLARSGALAGVWLGLAC